MMFIRRVRIRNRTKYAIKFILSLYRCRVALNNGNISLVIRQLLQIGTRDFIASWIGADYGFKFFRIFFHKKSQNYIKYNNNDLPIIVPNNSISIPVTVIEFDGTGETSFNTGGTNNHNIFYKSFSSRNQNKISDFNNYKSSRFRRNNPS